MHIIFNKSRYIEIIFLKKLKSRLFIISIHSNDRYSRNWKSIHNRIFKIINENAGIIALNLLNLNFHQKSCTGMNSLFTLSYKDNSCGNAW